MAASDMVTTLMEALTRKFDSQEECDVFFSVEGKNIGAHKVIMGMSEVLNQMVSGWTVEKEPITIDTVDYKTFKVLLRYMYSGEISISKENVFTYLSDATHFKMPSLENLCVDHALRSMGTENFSFYMNKAINLDSTILQQKCLRHFSLKTNEITEHSAFLELSQPALSALLEVDEINVFEISLFRAVKRWMEGKCLEENLAVNGTNMRRVIGDALFKIRFPTVTAHDFGNSVCTIKGLLTNEEIGQVFRKITVFDNSAVECSFPSNSRCEITQTTSRRQTGSASAANQWSLAQTARMPPAFLLDRLSGHPYENITRLSDQQTLCDQSSGGHRNVNFLVILLTASVIMRMLVNL